MSFVFSQYWLRSCTVIKLTKKKEGELFKDDSNVVAVRVKRPTIIFFPRVLNIWFEKFTFHFLETSVLAVTSSCVARMCFGKMMID